MNDAPNKIYLQVGDECSPDAKFSDLAEVTWSKDRVFANDIEYIRGGVVQDIIYSLELIYSSISLGSQRTALEVAESTLDCLRRETGNHE